MKIYSNTDVTVTPFDEYVGKDLWVRCWLTSDPNHDTYFIRFLRKTIDEDNPTHVIFITDSLNYDAVCRYCAQTHPNLHGLEYAKYIASISQAWVDTPMYYDATQLNRDDALVVALTSEKLFNYKKEDAHDNSIVDKIVGKPYWVRAKVNHHSDYYVSFSEKHGDVVECERINKGFLYDYVYGEDDPYPEDWFIDETIRLDNIEIYDPLDILTDEEVQELYEVSRSLWEESEGEE